MMLCAWPYGSAVGPTFRLLLKEVVPARWGGEGPTFDLLW